MLLQDEFGDWIGNVPDTQHVLKITSGQNGRSNGGQKCKREVQVDETPGGDDIQKYGGVERE